MQVLWVPARVPLRGWPSFPPGVRRTVSVALAPVTAGACANFTRLYAGDLEVSELIGASV